MYTEREIWIDILQKNIQWSIFSKNGMGGLPSSTWFPSIHNGDVCICIYICTKSMYVYTYIHIYIYKCVLCGAPSSTASSPSSTVMHVYGFIDILVHSVCVRRYVYICIYMLSKSMPELSFLRMARQGMIHLYAHTYMHVCIYIYI